MILSDAGQVTDRVVGVPTRPRVGIAEQVTADRAVMSCAELAFGGGFFARKFDISSSKASRRRGSRKFARFFRTHVFVQQYGSSKTSSP